MLGAVRLRRYTGGMCGRIARDRDRYADEFGFVEVRDTRARVRLPARFNIAPTQLDVLVRPTSAPGERDQIVRPAAGGREAVPSSWGLIPSWSKDRAIASKTFNARSESLLERASFRSLVGTHRCIIPASGFYEWTSGGKGKGKQPLYLHRRDGHPLALAGLWTTWTDPESGELVTSHTVITTAANAMMRPYHHRMPVLLSGEALDVWLDPTVTDPAAVLPLLVPAPEETLVARRVAPLVNDVRNEGEQLILPLDAA